MIFDENITLNAYIVCVVKNETAKRKGMLHETSVGWSEI